MRRRLVNLTITTGLGALLVVSGFLAPRSPAYGRTNGRNRHQVTGAFHVEHDVAWRTVDAETLTLDAYVPDGNGDHRAAVLLVHGGAWQHGDKSEFAPQGQALATAGYVAVSVNYRLAPAHPFPAAIDDVQAAVEWLRAPAQVRRYNIDPRRIGALGGSAGGHLVAMLGTLGAGPLDTNSRVAVVVSWSGLTDLAATGFPGFGKELFGCTSEECPGVATAASPVAHVDATDAPMLLVNSANDPITHVEQATEMANRLASAGVDHDVLVEPGNGHAIQLAPVAWNVTLTYLDHYLATSPSSAAA